MSKNASRLNEIISCHGWSGISLVGEEAAKNERRARPGLNLLEKRQEQIIEQERKRRANVAKTS